MNDTFKELYKLVESRKGKDPEKSYVAKLFKRGPGKIAQKVGEEAVETVIAALTEDKKAFIDESADLLFHLVVLWAAIGVKNEEVMAELEKRMGQSGLDEKAARKKRD